MTIFAYRLNVWMKANRIFVTAAIVVGIVLGGCKNDDSDMLETITPELREFSFEVPENGISENDRYWIIVSDAGGNVLDNEELVNGSVYTFQTPSNLTEDFITFTLFRYIRDGRNSHAAIQSYANVALGRYGFGGSADAAAGVPSDTSYSIRFYIDDFPGSGYFSDVNVSGPNGSINSFSKTIDATGGLKMDISSKKEKYPFLFSFVNDGVYRYIYEDAIAGESFEYSVKDLTLGGMSDIVIPPHDNVEYSMLGINNDGRFNYIWRDGIRLQRNVLALPYPNDVFKSYITAVETEKDGVNNYYRLEADTLPSKMKVISGEIQYTLEGNVIKSGNPEECDVVHYFVIENFSNGMTWDVVCAPGTQSVTVPLLPSSLAGMCSTNSFGDLYKKASQVRVWLSEYPELTGYEDYQRYGGYKLPYSGSLTESIQKSIYLNREEGGRHGNSGRLLSIQKGGD